MNNTKLLLIDDNEDNRLLTKMALEKSTNWRIVTASNGIEGVTKAELEVPDVILLDFIMPDIDGVLVYEILKDNLLTSKIPVIFVTAMANNEALFHLKSTGANGVITKPLNIATLAQNISSAAWHK
jgi:CheY-like chemotaxis protein